MGSLTIGLTILFLSLFYIKCWGVTQYPASINCKIQECVEYEVVHSQKEFEIRMYKAAKWVSSGYVTTVSYNVGYSAAYIQAYVFYKSENKEQFGFENNTQPVLTDIIPKTSYDSIYKTYLLVPKPFQNKIPTPWEWQEVKIVTLPTKKYAAVARVEGYLTDKTIFPALAALKNSLKGTPWEVAAASPNYTVADYQFQKFSQKDNRVNEVILWFHNNS